MLGLGSSPATLAQWAGPPLPGAQPAPSRGLAALLVALGPARLWTGALGLEPSGVSGRVGGESAEGTPCSHFEEAAGDSVLQNTFLDPCFITMLFPGLGTTINLRESVS